MPKGQGMDTSAHRHTCSVLILQVPGDHYVARLKPHVCHCVVLTNWWIILSSTPAVVCIVATSKTYYLHLISPPFFFLERIYALRCGTALSFLKFHCCLVHNHSMNKVFSDVGYAGKSGAVQPHPERTSICSAIPAAGRNKRWHRGAYSGSQNLFGCHRNSEVIHSQVKRCGKNPFWFFSIVCMYLHILFCKYILDCFLELWGFSDVDCGAILLKKTLEAFRAR